MSETDGAGGAGSFDAGGGGAGNAGGQGAGANGAGAGANGAGANGAAAPPAAEPRAAERYAEYQRNRDGGQSGPPKTPEQQQQARQSKPGDPPKAGASSDSEIDLGDGVKMTGAQIRELLANKAAADSKALQRPQSPDGYKAELPPDFQPAEGLPKFELNQNDPLLAQAKAIAHAEGMSQEAFSKLLGLYAGSQMISAQQVTAARNAEVAKLGATGPSRINALQTFFTAVLGAADGATRMARIFTAKDVEIAEREMSKLQNSGGTVFSGRGREPPPPSAPYRSPEEVARMSAAERLDYSRTFDQTKMPGWRDPRGA